MKTPLKIFVYGSQGRMGQELIHLLREDSQSELCGWRKSEADEDSLARSGADVAIEFTNPNSCLDIAKVCEAQKIPLVSGTTGLSNTQFQSLKERAKKIPLFWSANMSVGMGALTEALRLFVRLIDAAESRAEAHIEEVHHQQKRDKPSGTAKVLLEAIEASKPNHVKVEGITSVRAADVFGLHRVEFFADGERVLFEHQAQNRKVFAQGAIRASHWLAKQKPGFYTMTDWMRR